MQINSWYDHRHWSTENLRTNMVRNIICADIRDTMSYNSLFIMRRIANVDRDEESIQL